MLLIIIITRTKVEQFTIIVFVKLSIHKITNIIIIPTCESLLKRSAESGTTYIKFWFRFHCFILILIF